MTEIEQPPQNGIDLTTDDDENSKARPADIEQDMREMERRKRVEAIMGSKLFREELERIVDTAREGGASGILQQLSDIVGLPSARVGNVFKASNCMLPINDIRGVESMGYAKGEKILRCKLAATFRLLDLYGWTQGLGAQVTARLKVDQEVFLVNPYGMLYHEITASSLNKVDMQGQVVEQGTTNFGVNKNHFILHSIVHAARPDIRCAIYIGCSPVVAVSSLKTGLLPLTRDACVLGEITTHAYTGSLIETEERDKLVRNLGPNSKVMLLSNHGALCCGESIEEAFFAACHIVQACETQLRLLPVGVDNLVLIPEESRKTIYEQARRPPEDLEKKFAAALANTEKNQTATGDGEDVKDDAAAVKTVAASQKAPNWRVGGAEFEALMRMLDNAGYRTGYIYRHPLVKSELPKPKNDVELPPAVSSLGYLLEEEELYRQGIWKKGDLRKGGDRCRWLNSPNVYQKVEVLETGTPDPKKITKWVAEGSPTHGTPVRIEDPLQFVPAGTNPKEFKRVQQQIKDNRRADKISAGPQSHILEGVTWDEANRIKDATVSSAGDHVVLMGAASKGIIQRGFQHNATVYKTPYAKNPFDNVTDDELNEYKRTVERKKKSIHGEYTDTDFSETEALSSVHASAGATLMKHTVAAVSQSEPEDTSEHQVMRIETQQAPVPSQPEVILSDATLDFINGERSHTSTNRKPPTGRDSEQVLQIEPNQKCQDHVLIDAAGNKENIFAGNQNISRNKELIAELKNDLLFQRQKEKLVASPTKANDGSFLRKSTRTDKKTKEPFPDKDNSNVATFTTSKNIPIHSNQNNDKIITETSSNKANENNNNITSDAITQNSNNELIIPSSCQKLGPFSNPTPPNSSNYYYEMMFASSELPTYDTARSNDYKSAFESADSDRLYTKSLFCYTPNVCDSVFESLQRPLDNDLILNIPFTIPIQPPTSATSTPRKQQPLPSDIQQSDSITPTSPYRTLSHFGFNSPNSTPQPEHKHIPRQLTTKYVPLTKSTSYEEIFSSPRYVDLCENCFEKIVRLKPELVYIKTRLRNLVDFNGSNKVEGIEAVGCGSTETTETLPAFPAALEPVIEESSEEGSDGRLKSLEKSISNSTFIEKITRMNYSEESANVNFLNTPRTVSSNISLEGETDQQEHKELKDIEEHLTTEMQQLKLNVECRDELSQCGSVTEIWEFGNWQDQQPLVTDADDVNVDADRTLTAKHNSTGSNESRRSKRRRFMSREERNQRKHEFQELWEDHITFFNNKDETLSDTESAIDETTGNAIRVQAQQMEQSREVFHGRSMVTKRLFSDPLEDEHLGNEVDAWIQLKNIDDVEVVDDCRFKYSLNVEECEELNAGVVKSSDAGQLMTLNYNKEHNELNNEEVSEGSHDTRLRQLHFHSDAEDEVAKLSNEEMAESSDGCTSTRTFNVHNSKEQLIFRDDVGNDACNGDGFNMHVLKNKSPFELNDNVGLKYSPRAEEFVLFDQNPDDFPKLATEMETNVDPLSCSDSETSARTKLTELNNNEYKEFNSLERIILEKIEINQLKESEVIFDKIENTIRNKLTPSKIEELLQKQKKLLKDGLAGTTNSQFSSSTPSKIATLKHGSEEDGSFSSLNLSRIFEEDTAHDNDDSPSAHMNLLSCSLNCEKDISNHQNCLSLPNPIDKFQTFQDLTKTYQSDFMRFRRSRSLTLCNKKVLENKKSPPLSQNQISVTLAEPQTTRSSPEIRTKFGKPSPAYKRNFVLENIRNASIPRNVKRLQRSNTNAIFLKNPFGATSSVTPVTSTGTSNQSTKESDVVSTDVYAFQTKLVRGSPRFWVSMSQTPAKKLQNTKTLQMRRKKPLSKLHASSSSISTGTFTDLETPSTSASYIRTKVDVDLAALSLEIEDVKPHLERYKRKLDDYGEHVAKCARNMEECIEVQLDIQEEHKKLRDDILLNQYIEEISCNVQTFSISETED